MVATLPSSSKATFLTWEAAPWWVCLACLPGWATRSRALSMTLARSAFARRSYLPDHRAIHLTGTRSSRALPSAVSSAPRRGVFQPRMDLVLKSSPAVVQPSPDVAHAFMPASDLVPLRDCERTKPSPLPTSAAMSSLLLSPLSATATTRPMPCSAFMSASTGTMVCPSVVLPRNRR